MCHKLSLTRGTHTCTYGQRQKLIIPHGHCLQASISANPSSLVLICCHMVWLIINQSVLKWVRFFLNITNVIRNHYFDFLFRAVIHYITSQKSPCFYLFIINPANISPKWTKKRKVKDITKKKKALSLSQKQE